MKQDKKFKKGYETKSIGDLFQEFFDKKDRKGNSIGFKLNGTLSKEGEYRGSRIDLKPKDISNNPDYNLARTESYLRTMAHELLHHVGTPDFHTMQADAAAKIAGTTFSKNATDTDKSNFLDAEIRKRCS